MDKTVDNSNASNSGNMKPKLTFRENKMLFIKKKFIGFLKMIWNPKKKQFLNKDGQDWTRISLFYVIFYAAIGGFTWAMMAIFMGITKAGFPDRPRYTSSKSIFEYSTFSPGMSVRPHFGSGSATISTSDPLNVDFLNLFLQSYHENINHTVLCNSTTKQAPVNAACRHPIFDYLKTLECDESTGYGYHTGNPCVFIKINNIFDWKPKGPQLPSNKTYSSNCNNTNTLLDPKAQYIYITCNGKSDEDKKNINSMTFASALNVSNDCIAGVPFYFYPYQNIMNYMQPIIPMKLNLTANVAVNIECYAWAKDLVQDKKQGYGYVNFQITVNKS